MALHETGDLTCSRCGASLAGLSGTVDPDVGGGASADLAVRTHVECPECCAALDIVVESALPDAIGVDVYVEDGHRSPSEERAGRDE